MRANVSIVVKFRSNTSDLFEKLAALDIRLTQEPDSPVLDIDELIGLPSDQSVELFVTHAYGIDAIRNAKHAAYLIQEAGGEAVVGEKTVTMEAENLNLVTTNANFGERLKKLIEAKKFDPGLAIFDETTLASKSHDDAEDRIATAPPIR